VWKNRIKMSITATPVKRVLLSTTELEELTKEELIEKWAEQECYINSLEATHQLENKNSLELISLRETEERLKQQQLEATRRENVLVMRLTTKEQEMQEYANQIQELKQSQLPGASQLRCTLMDPAVNLLFERMKKELETTKAKLEETHNELSAWKFTPDRWTSRSDLFNRLSSPRHLVSALLNCSKIR